MARALLIFPILATLFVQCDQLEKVREAAVSRFVCTGSAIMCLRDGKRGITFMGAWRVFPGWRSQLRWISIAR